MDCNIEHITHDLKSEISAIFNAIEVIESQKSLDTQSLEILKLISEKRQTVENNLRFLIQELKKGKL